MITVLQRILHDYLVLFAMVNAFGNLPVLWELTRAMTRAERARTFRVAVSTACVIVLVFAVFGNWMLQAVFQVEVSAFKIAGGVLVFAVAARGVLQGPRALRHTHQHFDDVAIFPMAFPFLVGPGTIVATILLMQQNGRGVTALTALLVYATVFPLLFLSPLIEKALGRVGALVVTRILYVFIAAKAVAFLTDGIRTSFGLGK